ncbi:MAG: TIGR02147 family protein [Proteobacteria bacterium]|nr:MAG: TIGR02147 family protein [Pseudomonadota bacterium]
MVELRRPEIFDYLDARQYLNDLYSYRKSLEPGFSFEAWAEELGFRSRSHLRMCLIGKRKISPLFIEKLGRTRGFNQKEQNFWEALVPYTQAPTLQQRDAFGRTLIDILKTISDRPKISESIEFLADPLHLRLLVLIGMGDIVPTLKNLSRLLEADGPRVSTALEILKSLDLASESVVDGESHYLATKKNFDVPDGLGSASILRFHELSLKQSIEAFHSPKEFRRYRSLIVPLTDDEYAELIRNLEAYIDTQLVKYRSDSYRERRLFQLNVNVSPVSKALEDQDGLTE